jgi:hypothetical protein
VLVTAVRVPVVVVPVAGEQDQADEVDPQANEPDDEDQHGIVDRFELVKAFERLDDDGEAEGEEEDRVDERSEDFRSRPAESRLGPLFRRDLNKQERFLECVSYAKTIHVKIEKSWRVKRRHWCYWIGLDSLFQKTPIITPRERTVQPGDAFEDTTFKPGFEIVKL